MKGIGVLQGTPDSRAPNHRVPNHPFFLPRPDVILRFVTFSWDGDFTVTLNHQRLKSRPPTFGGIKKVKARITRSNLAVKGYRLAKHPGG